MVSKVSGAADQIRTGDLILTKDALYLLSYSSKHAPYSGHVATEKGLEPSTSSVTGWRANRLHHSASNRLAIIQKTLAMVKPFSENFEKYFF